MSKHLQRELDHLKRDLLACGTLVQQAIQKSVLALEERRGDLAEEVVRDDERVDQMEVEVEENCLKILALHQPVAEDLRFVASVIRINSDLERIGDYAESIASRALDFMKAPLALPKSLRTIGELSRHMVRDALEAFVRKDAALARRVHECDDEVDGLHREVFREIRDRIRAQPDEIDALFDLLTISRRLERIADMATNIAQDVVYMVEGEIVRHTWLKPEGHAP